MSPGTVLMLTFAGLVVGWFAFFWGTTLFLQSALYSVPVSKLPIRAAIAALLIGGFLTFWTFVNTRAESKDRYGTFFEFNPTSSSEFAEFTAIRRDANKNESRVAYKKVGGSFVEVQDPSKSFVMNTSSFLVTGIEVKEGEKATKFEAQFDAKGNYISSNKVFVESGGRRYIEFGQTNTPSPIYAPSRGALFAAIGLNLLLYVVLFIAFWPILQYTSGHALGGTVGIGLFVMLLLMPLLFDKNKVPESYRLPEAAAQAG